MRKETPFLFDLGVILLACYQIHTDLDSVRMPSKTSIRGLGLGLGLGVFSASLAIIKTLLVVLSRFLFSSIIITATDLPNFFVLATLTYDSSNHCRKLE
jgi:hypothetical protein